VGEDPRVAELDNCRDWTIGEPRPMCETAIRKVCSARGQYETPHLNDCLYLQMCGFTSIGGLQAYSGIHSLFLMSNQLHRIEGLDCLCRLRMLYLNSNGLTHIEGLQHCKNLEYLNISNNRIRTVMNLEELTSLKTLIVANNHICNIASDLSPGISQIPWLLSLDVSYNLLEASPTEGTENGTELISFLQSCCPKLNDFYAY
ncbi:leucine-rich-repeat protein 4.1, putative, partial [Perkinsus marinus ATCC 50983]